MWHGRTTEIRSQYVVQAARLPAGEPPAPRKLSTWSFKKLQLTSSSPILCVFLGAARFSEPPQTILGREDCPMLHRSAAIVIVLALYISLPFECRAAESVDSLIQAVVKQRSGTPEGRAAWNRLAAAGPGALPAILKALNTADTVTANWLRTAFDRIFEQALRADKGRPIDTDVLLAFAREPRNSGRARRLALEVVERLQPGTSARLYPGWLDDPEFRYEAVEVALAKADALVKTNKEMARVVYRKAFAAVRDLQQARKVAAALEKTGVHVSVAKHLGFLTDWYVIGPFDANGMKGFKTVYPPERGIDLKVELEGKGKKVRWIRFRAPEPPPSAGGPHVALVNLIVSLGNADDAVAYAYTEINVARAQDVEFRGAADDNFTVWVNGKREFGFEEYRNGVRLDRHRFPVKLRAGKNTVLVKICQFPATSEPNWEFLLRIVDKMSKGIDFTTALPEVKHGK
jgi:hypothetical protein